VKGGRIDITLPAEDGIPRGGARAAARTRAPETEDEGDATERAEAQALGDLAQELGEEVETAESPTDGEGEEEAESADAEGDEDAAVEQLAAATGEDDLDSLPDISNLEVAPSAEEGGARPSRHASGGDSPQDAVKGSLSGQDPATLARAIRTVLSKDEKG